MIWFLTFFLCLILVLSFLAMLNPNLVLPPLANYWRRRAHYKHH